MREGFTSLTKDNKFWLGRAYEEAAAEGDFEELDRFEEIGVHVNDTGALTSALLAKSEALVLHLLERGADPNPREGDNTPPLVFAVWRMKPMVVEKFLEMGADVDVEQGFPLQAAAGSGRIDIVKLLLEAGADPSIRTSEGKTAADIARDEGHQECAALLESS